MGAGHEVTPGHVVIRTRPSRAFDQDASEPGLRSGRERAGPPAVRPRRHRQARGWASRKAACRRSLDTWV